MSDTLRRPTGTAAEEDPLSHAVPETVAGDLSLDEADDATRAEIEARMSEIDLGDSQSIMSFGSGAQRELQDVSQSMLAGVRNKDIGPAGDSLRAMVSTIRGFSISELDLRRDRTLWEKVLRRATPIAKFSARFEEVQTQVDRITDDLHQHEHALLKDIEALDRLYDKTLAFYEEISVYIAAGEAKLRDVDDRMIPAAEAAVTSAPEAERMLRSQEARDLQAARDDLERRVHDLRLTRQITMQSLPSIRLVQENDKSLVSKINSTLVNTVPLWETQLAQSVTIHRSTRAAEALREASDLTNDLLTANARNLRRGNAAVREEMERGVVDIEALKAANADLVATINESLQIADEGKRRRAEAEGDLARMETELRQALSGARSAAADTPGSRRR